MAIIQTTVTSLRKLIRLLHESSDDAELWKKISNPHGRRLSDMSGHFAPGTHIVVDGEEVEIREDSMGELGRTIEFYSAGTPNFQRGTHSIAEISPGSWSHLADEVTHFEPSGHATVSLP